jgi:transcription antitermination factor NusG
MLINLPQYIDSKDARVYARNEEGCIHVSWDIEDGKIMAFEYIPDNYPDISCTIFKNDKEYKRRIYNIDWIQNCISDESPDKFSFKIGDTVKVIGRYYNGKTGTVVDIQHSRDTGNILLIVNLGGYIGNIKMTEDMIEKEEE